MPPKIVIAGGGAAGFFAAITCAETNPEAEVIILERGKKVLEKVKVSGGGRCNVTHACFDPNELIHFYPRGSKALLGPFHHFCTGDTVEWFESRGVKTKIEADGRMFPVTNDSQTIIDCLLAHANSAGVKIMLQTRVDKIEAPSAQNDRWQISLDGDKIIETDKLMIATGSNPKIWQLLEKLGHTIVRPVPSLFTFNIKDERIQGLEGLSVNNVHVTIPGTKLEAEGPLLITHWGMSGPGILKLSAWGAKILNELNYNFSIIVNWLGDWNIEKTIQVLQQIKQQMPAKQVASNPQFQIPARLWKRLVAGSGIDPATRWSDLSHRSIASLAEQLSRCSFEVKGKSTFKEEFVTAGGVELDEVNFKRFESRIHKNLFFAGEVLDIDAITGGFNFQAAWTGGWIAGKAMAEK